jgi:PAS domain S-box-containing protein
MRTHAAEGLRRTIGRRLVRAAAAVLLLAALLELAPPALRPCLAGIAADQEQELVAVVPGSMPPLYTTGPDGRPSGFSTELLRALCSRAGYRLRFITAPSLNEAMALLEQGKANIIPGLGISPERRTRLLFTAPFETQSVHIYFRSGAPARETLDDLEGARVTALNGSLTQEFLAAHPGIIVDAVGSLPQALFNVVSGESDALVFQSPLADDAAAAAGLGPKLVRSQTELFSISRAIAVSAANPNVHARLDAAFDSFRNTQEYRALYAEWHVAPARNSIPQHALLLLGGLLLILAAGLLLWRYVSILRMNRKLIAALSARDAALAELRLSQERMQALTVLTNMGGQDNECLIKFALDEGVRLTGSEMGFLLFLHEGKVDLARVYWAFNNSQWRPTQAMVGVYPLSEAGLWADCLRTGKPTVINDYLSAPRKKTLPEGHAPLLRFMAVPLLDGAEPMAVFCVANKRDPYDDNDSRQLQLFLAGLWQVLASRKAAESLRQAKDYALSLIEGANVMVVSVDTEGRITLFNAAAENISGYERNEVLGRGWWGAMLPAHLAEAGESAYRSFMAGRTALPRQQEGPLRTKDGRMRHISWQSSLLREGDTVTGILAYGIDITEQKQAEAELHRLHKAIGQAAEGVLIADETGAILYANPAMERMAGLDRSKGSCSLFDLGITVLDHHSSALPGEGGEGVWRGTCVFSKPGGAPVEVEFTVTSMRARTDRKTSYVAVCRDVTEKRQLEHQLWQAQKMEALGTLAGGIAHDFNNILASIIGFTELALDDTGEQSRGRACLDRVLAASMRARELVRRILSFSRRSEHKLQPLNVDEVIAEALNLLEASLEKNIEIQPRLAAGVTVMADPSQMHQIVMNLCTNAAQAMKGAGGHLRIGTSAGALGPELATRFRLPSGRYLTLTVEDEGVGIAPDLLLRIFDPFFTTKAPGEGTGLGLSVVHGIATSLGGTVWAESDPGKGARFTVLLPTHVAAPEDATPLPRGDLRGKERVLLVDDEPDLLELGRLALTPFGYHVTTEDSPEKALRLLIERPDAFDLLITDMNMPRLSGVQLAEALRQMDANLPVILITGFNKDMPSQQLEELGVVLVLHKPFTTGDLAHAVRQALAGQRKGVS